MWLIISLFTKVFNFENQIAVLQSILKMICNRASIAYSKENKTGSNIWNTHLSLFPSSHDLG